MTLVVMVGASFLFSTFFENHPFWFISLTAGVYIGLKIFLAPPLMYEKVYQKQNSTPEVFAEATPAAPQVSQFSPFLNFSDLLKATHEGAKDYLKNTLPSSISLFVHLGKTSRYPVPLESLIQFEKLNSIQWYKTPVLSLPQKKTHYFGLGAKIILNEMKQSTDIQTLEIKGSDVDQGYVNLLLFTSSLLCAHRQKSNIPFLYPLPEATLHTPHTRKIFLDLLEHPQFPKHMFVFLVSKEIMQNDFEKLSNLQEKGARFAFVVDDFNTATIPEYITLLCVNQTDIQKQLDGMARRLANHLLQTFSEQPQKIILSNVDNLEFLQDILPTQFDYAFGPAFGQKEIEF
jgi:hypothetical protein